MKYSNYNLQLLRVLNCGSILHSVKRQVQLHFSCTVVSSEDSSASHLLMLQTQYKGVHAHVSTCTDMRTLVLCLYKEEEKKNQECNLHNRTVCRMSTIATMRATPAMMMR